ncbi:hypothetical protein SAMN03159489_02219 [Pseudomonas sp. NFPP07]|uniref:hypothetical protein n=1 Tax=Pseudomonas sp. NFPP07 TaxID=1566213 RepID=UPI0008E8CA01|nr:hypothetical protein [Pseudomonas sp. NFPP07]SFP93139.1 hypothetical protein SAMN03159489_02219 [Pseudomonas sp. NFPP07]
MSALREAQFEYDERLPPPVSESPRENARADWIYDATETLCNGGDVSFQRRFRQRQGVTAKQFELALDQFANSRLADCQVSSPALGALLIEARCGCKNPTSIVDLLGYSSHRFGVFGEIAEALLEPLADDALIAIAEDNEL